MTTLDWLWSKPESVTLLLDFFCTEAYECRGAVGQVQSDDRPPLPQSRTSSKGPRSWKPKTASRPLLIWDDLSRSFFANWGWSEPLALSHDWATAYIYLRYPWPYSFKALNGYSILSTIEVDEDDPVLYHVRLFEIQSSSRIDTACKNSRIWSHPHSRLRLCISTTCLTLSLLLGSKNPPGQQREN